MARLELRVRHEVIEEIEREGGQARGVTGHLDASAGMHDLARVASELFQDGTA